MIHGRTGPGILRTRLAVVILNYRTPSLVIDCLATVVPQVNPTRDRIIVVDNASGDDSVDRIEKAIERQGWLGIDLVRSGINGGFAAGNNLGMRSVVADHYLLLNSDTLLREGAVARLLDAIRRAPDVGIVSPRLEWPDGVPQISCFRNRTPRTELVSAASTGLVTRVLGGGEIGIPITQGPTNPEWTSFAAVLIRGAVLADVGMLDEAYFMYFEDLDYCRRVRSSGWVILNEPAARVVHLRGGSSTVKSSSAVKKRLPRYYYASRSRYFATYYGTGGLWLANALWTIGAAIAGVRRLIGLSGRRPCDREWLDNWTNWTHPVSTSRTTERTSRAAA